MKPIHMASWAASGPGIIWAKASPSLYSSSDIQRRGIRSRCMYPARAMGPPKPREPRRRKYSTSSHSPTGLSLSAAPWAGCSPMPAILPGEVDVIECRFQPYGELPRFVVSPEMEEEKARRLEEHVAVHGSDGETVVNQRLDHRVYLTADKDEITGGSGPGADH